MPIINENRVGPNQDVNNPLPIIQTLGRARIVHDRIAAYKDKFDAGDPLLPTIISGAAFPVNDIISDIEISLITTSGDITYNSDWASGSIFFPDFNIIGPKEPFTTALINSYSFMPELLREWWSILNDTNGTIMDYDSFQLTDSSGPSGVFITLPLSGNPDASDNEVFLHDSQTFTFSSIRHIMPAYLGDISGTIQSIPTPIWEGEGPTSYFDTTFPQIYDKFVEISVIDETTSGIYEKTYETLEAAATSSSSIAYLLEMSVPAVQIYNSGASPLSIPYEAFINATSTNGLVQVSLTAKIQAEVSGLNDFLFPDTYEEDLFTGSIGAGQTVSVNGSINIPPLQSLFAIITSLISVTTSAGDTVTAECSVSLNGRTRSRTIDMVTASVGDGRAIYQA